MSLKNVENSYSGYTFYSLKDKAYQYALNQRFKAFDRIDALREQVDTKEKLSAYHEKIKNNFKKVIGGIPYDKDYPLDMKVFKTIEEENLLIKNIVFTSRENVYITANLYIPESREPKAPAVLLQCGHSKNGKASTGYQRAARIIASVGIIVLVTDPVGQGEREEYFDENGNSIISPAVGNHQQFGNQCFLAGNSPIKYFLADAMRSIDLLCSLDEVDNEKIGATGISGGGTMTSILMAYDDRIKAAAPGCWPCSGREYFVVGTAPDSEQHIPDILSNDLDVFEIMLCQFPKPLLFISAKYDFIPFEGVKRLFNETKRLYALSGNQDNVQISVVNKPHGYAAESAKDAAEFFAKHLLGKELDVSIDNITTLNDEQLFCTKSGKALADIEGSISAFEENLKEFNAQTPLSDKEKYDFLESKVFLNRPKDNEIIFRKLTESFYTGVYENLWVQPYIWLTHDMMPCHGIMFKNEDMQNENLPVTICLWQGGTDNLSENSEKIHKICNSKRAAFVVDLTAMGKCSPNKMLGENDVYAATSSMTDKIAKSLFATGDSLCALKTYDLMQTIRVLKEEFSEDVELYTVGKYCVFGRLAQILNKDIKITFENEIKVSDIIKNKYYDSYDIAQIIMPGIGLLLD